MKSISKNKIHFFTLGTILPVHGPGFGDPKKLQFSFLTYLLGGQRIN